MKALRFIWIWSLWGAAALAQNPTEQLLHEMKQFEKSIVSIYRAYQWLYYEEKQSQAELLSFEDLLGVYVKRLQQAYDTVVLIGQEGVDEARDITSRAYVYRALTFLEKAPLDLAYFERACYDYYEALQLYNRTSSVPVIFKPLPEPIRLGGKSYTRLIDLLDEKGHDLFAFGQVHLLLQNFKVTADFDEQGLQLIRAPSATGDTIRYTYQIAEKKLKEGFHQAFQSAQPVNIYLALPAGTYYIRSATGRTPEDYVDLAKIFVQPNQFVSYIVEPIADWIIFYETPEYLLKTVESGGRADAADVEISRLEHSFASKVAQQISYRQEYATDSSEQMTEYHQDVQKRLQKIKSRLESVLDELSLQELEELPILRTRKEFIERLAHTVVNNLSGEYLSSWNRWTFAWNVAKEAMQNIDPDQPVPTVMVKIVYQAVLESQ